MTEREIPLPSTNQLMDLLHRCQQNLIGCIWARMSVDGQACRGLPCGAARDELVRLLDEARGDLLYLTAELQGWYEGKAVTARASERAIDASNEEALFQALAQLYPPGTTITVQPAQGNA